MGLDPPPEIENPTRYRAHCIKCGVWINKHSTVCMHCVHGNPGGKKNGETSERKK